MIIPPKILHITYYYCIFMYMYHYIKSLIIRETNEQHSKLAIKYQSIFL